MDWGFTLFLTDILLLALYGFEPYAFVHVSVKISVIIIVFNEVDERIILCVDELAITHSIVTKISVSVVIHHVCNFLD